METGERLAAYLAGELGVDETRALEAELDRDERLRARLEAIRATDAALASLAAVEPPGAFAERLRSAVQAELDQQLPTEGDELGARRVRKARGTAATRSWWPQVAVAAAVLAVAGIGISQLATGGADSGVDESAEHAGTLEAAREPAVGPVVVAAGRSFDADNLRDLADDATFDEIVNQGLAGDAAAMTAREFGEVMGGGTAGDTADDSGPAGAAAAPETEEAAPPEAFSTTGDVGLRTRGEVSDADLEAVNGCLPALLEGQEAVIPAYAELATFEGQDAIVYGLVGNDPAQESHSRVELWVVARGDCQVLYYTPVDR